MALIIQGTPCPCPECSTNNGKVVTLLRHVPAYEPVHLDHGLTVSYGTPSWVCEGQLHLPTTAGLIPFSYLPFPASRLVRIDNLTPGDVMTIGSDQWKCFPVIRKNGGPGLETSLNWGYAYRVVP
jgi:hypothetical protein